MSLGKQAKILSDTQQTAVLAYLSTSRNELRNTVMFLLSVDAGLRAKEIANLEWSMLTDAEGRLSDKIVIPNQATKGSSGGVIYMSKRLQSSIRKLANSDIQRKFVVTSCRGNSMSAQVVTNWFFNLYRKLGYRGCSSHSGRRTAITRWSRKISLVGGSLRDVQALARHKSITTTQKYIEVSEHACRMVVN